jgi:hypothetical protein
VQGIFPAAWKVAAGRLTYLNLSGNKKLVGCIPLPSTLVHGDDTSDYIAVYGRIHGVNIDGTGLQGLCPADATAEQRQRNALKELLPLLLFGTGPPGPIVDGSNAMVAAAVAWSSKLGSLVLDGDSTFFTRSHPVEKGYVFMFILAETLNGTEYVTWIVVMAGSMSPPEPAVLCPTADHRCAMGINMQHLSSLLRQLPKLARFVCTECCGNTVTTELLLPSSLPSAAPNLQDLLLQGVGATGPLPHEWANWTSIRSVDLGCNDVNGTLPASYAGMKGLKSIDLSYNQLTGSLPSPWGGRKLMPPSLALDVAGNRMHSTVPPSWSHFTSGIIYASADQLYGCLPNGIRVSPTLPRCTNSSAETAALRRLRTLLGGNDGGSSQLSLLAAWNDTKGVLHMRFLPRWKYHLLLVASLA